MTVWNWRLFSESLTVNRIVNVLAKLKSKLPFDQQKQHFYTFIKENSIIVRNYARFQIAVGNDVIVFRKGGIQLFHETFILSKKFGRI